jgi:hypothetical protein
MNRFATLNQQLRGPGETPAEPEPGHPAPARAEVEGSSELLAGIQHEGMVGKWWNAMAIGDKLPGDTGPHADFKRLTPTTEGKFSEVPGDERYDFAKALRRAALSSPGLAMRDGKGALFATYDDPTDPERSVCMYLVQGATQDAQGRPADYTWQFTLPKAKAQHLFLAVHHRPDTLEDLLASRSIGELFAPGNAERKAASGLLVIDFNMHNNLGYPEDTLSHALRNGALRPFGHPLSPHIGPSDLATT